MIDELDVENAREKWVKLEAKASMVDSSNDLHDMATNARVSYLELKADYWKQQYDEIKRTTHFRNSKSGAENATAFVGTRNKKKPVLRLKGKAVKIPKGLDKEQQKIAERLFEPNQSRKVDSETDKETRNKPHEVCSDDSEGDEESDDGDNNSKPFRYSIAQAIRRRRSNNAANGSIGQG